MSDADRLIRELRAEIRDERVLAALGHVPRERFVRPEDSDRAYANSALEIGCGQTISQPLVVARMTELLELEPSDRVLDVGTGSGYAAAVLAGLCAHVWSVERYPQLAKSAAQTLRELGLDNITTMVGDGTQGLPEASPFDAINVAAATAVAPPPALEAQLAPGGRLVLPVGRRRQFLVRVRRTARGLERERLEPVRFVPLVPDDHP